MSRTPALLAVLLAAAAGLAACSDDDPRPSGRTTTAPDTVDAPTTTTGSPPTTRAAPDGDPATARVAIVEFATGLDQPVAVAARPDSDLLYVAEQHSGVRIVAADGTIGAQALDLADRISTGNEQGVLGIAFAPEGEHAYVDYTDTDGHTHVAEYALAGDGFDAASERDVLFVEQPYANHNGGDIRFGPDGMLYVALGDGGAGGDPQGNGQDRESLLGKILRIDPAASGTAAYSVPADNPFVGAAGADEIWAYGLRNPWRFSFDRATGDLWIGDVGQGLWEEIDHTPAGVGGSNFGWNVREGFHAYEGGGEGGGSAESIDAVDPVFELAHTDGNCSVTGGFVYRGGAIAELVGAYVFGDYCAGDLLALDLRGDTPRAVPLDLNVAELTSFGEDNRGELYAAGRGGSLWKLVAATAG